jgi:hypothetical protein
MYFTFIHDGFVGFSQGGELTRFGRAERGQLPKELPEETNKYKG